MKKAGVFSPAFFMIFHALTVSCETLLAPVGIMRAVIPSPGIPSSTLPGRLALGAWQRVFHVKH
jgi:hypothetical protein